MIKMVATVITVERNLRSLITDVLVRRGHGRSIIVIPSLEVVQII